VVLIFVIWGSVIKKHFGGENSGPNLATEVMPMQDYNYNRAVVSDTFKLRLAKRDPFQTSRRRYATTKNTTKNTGGIKKTNRPKTNKTLVWPQITYHGFVKSDRNNTKLVIVKINNKLFRKRENERVENVKILKAYNDSLKVSFNNNLKTIIKAQ